MSGRLREVLLYTYFVYKRDNESLKTTATATTTTTTTTATALDHSVRIRRDKRTHTHKHTHAHTHARICMRYVYNNTSHIEVVFIMSDRFLLLATNTFRQQLSPCWLKPLEVNKYSFLQTWQMLYSTRITYVNIYGWKLLVFVLSNAARIVLCRRSKFSLLMHKIILSVGTHIYVVYIYMTLMYTQTDDVVFHPVDLFQTCQQHCSLSLFIYITI